MATKSNTTTTETKSRTLQAAPGRKGPVLSSDIPLPPKQGRAPAEETSLLKSMKPNQSFFVPVSDPKKLAGKTSGMYTRAKNAGVKISVRNWKEGNETGIRVWRV